MKRIEELEAVRLAEEFVSASKSSLTCGALTSVKHKAVNMESGTYYVEFAYAGPTTAIDTTPPRSHPTVILVDDLSGSCRLMRWL